MTASGVIAIGACTCVLGWAAYHVVKGALAERDRRYREACLIMRVRAREEQEARDEAREFGEAMARMGAWCREQTAKAEEQIRELERLFELPCAPDPEWRA